MVRLAAILPLILCFPQSSLAESPEGTDPRITRALAIQTAMTQAKDHLQGNRPAAAVAVLEAEILYVNGNAGFLALMKEAYLACLKDLKRQNADPDRVDHVVRQLRILDPKLTIDEAVIVPAKAEEIVFAPAKPATPPMPAVAESDDPFQQTPLDRVSAQGGVKSLATAAFSAKKYAEAAALFKQAQQANDEFTAEEKQAWAYCRLHVVVTKLNGGSDSGLSLAALEKEAEEASKLGGPALETFGQQALTAIRKRKPKEEPTAVPDGWQTVESGSFRVFFQQSRQQATEIAKAAEAVRTATFEKWAGPPGADWSPRCDVWLHATANDYARTTHKPAASPGHASVGIKDGKVQVRRLDLRLDDANLLDVTLPHEVAYVVVSDLFPEQPLPRWADVGMTILAEPPAEVSRYLRAVPKLIQERRMVAVRDFLKMAEFPEAAKITPFYVESVSLVDYLVRLKGPKAFALYLREAPRRGYEEALQRHYGFKDANELQERWMKFALGGE